MAGEFDSVIIALRKSIEDKEISVDFEGENLENHKSAVIACEHRIVKLIDEIADLKKAVNKLLYS